MKGIAMSSQTNSETTEIPAGAHESAGTSASTDPATTGILTIREQLPGAPVPEDALMPTGYELEPETGMIFHTEPKRKVPVPLVEVLVVSRELVHHDGQTVLELDVLRRNAWQKAVVPAEAAASKRKLVEHLAAQGVTIDDGNSGDVMKYLREFRRVNDGVIPSIRVTPRSGWLQRGEAPAFALGREVLGPGAAGFVVRPGSSGEDQVLDFLKAEGSIDAWRTMVSEIPDNAPVLLGLYAAALPPVMQIIGRPGVLMLEFIGTTSVGKTSALQLAASLYGVPGGNGAFGLLQGWNQTDCGLERRAALTPDLPIFLDELSADAGAGVESRLYQLTTGQSKQRGSVDGLRETTVYRGVLLSSGEESIESRTRKAGLLVRLVSIGDPPFVDDNQAALVRRVKDTCRDNFGHGGRLLIEFLARLSPAYVTQWRAFLVQLEAYFRRGALGAVAGRAADSYALLALAGSMLHQACGIEGDPVARVMTLWQAARARFVDDVPLIARAVAFVNGWYAANRSKFAAYDGTSGGVSSGTDCWGFAESRPDGMDLVVVSDVFSRALSTAGLDPKVTIAELNRAGLLTHEAEHLTVKKTLPGGQRLRCYVIRLADDDDADQSVPPAAAASVLQPEL
jgi:hypothetical protein